MTPDEKIAKLEPYLQFIGVIVGVDIFFVVLWIITQINLTNQVPV
jgi:hypothetical protein